MPEIGGSAEPDVTDTRGQFAFPGDNFKASETILGAKSEPGKGCVRAFDTELGGAVVHSVNVEVVEVNAVPAHSHLQDAVKLAQRNGFRHPLQPQIMGRGPAGKPSAERYTWIL